MPILPPKTTHLEHGVFVVIRDIGVLIRGQPGLGKSSLALELLDRGHALISDDAVKFEATPFAAQPYPKHHLATTLIGSAPSMLQNLLAVRDIGVLDVTKIFSAAAIIAQHSLDFVVELVSEQNASTSDITNLYTESLIFGHKFPSQRIFAHPGRNIALIVETVIKNYILYKTGQDAGQTLIGRQQQYL